MTTRFRHLIVIVTAAFAVSAMNVATASAQYPPPEDGDFAVACTPESPAAGDEVECAVAGAVAGETIPLTASVNGSEFHEDTETASEAGTASFAFNVPDDAEGDVTVTVVGSESGETTTTVLSVAVDDEGEEVTPAPSDDELPITGGQVLMLSLLGAMLLAGGLLFLRRRGTATAKV